jgi:thiosulfate/3-mercaptopyruvate sulfurtransferase
MSSPSVFPVRTLILHALAAMVLAAACLGAVLAPAAAADTEPLVSVDWLAAHRGDPGLVILDVRSAIDGGGTEAYAKAHIPGAVHSDYDKAGWRVTRNGVPFMLPTVAELEKLIGELGIDEESRVVVVPAGVHASDFGAAARVYWTLKVAGLARVSILDGGFAAWTAAGQPVESGLNPPSPKIFTATLDQRLIAEARDVEQVESSGSATLVDARPASFFAGHEKAPAAKAYGHLAGAINVDNASFYDAKTNRLKPRAELAAIASRVPPGPAITYCNTGHWAATDWFVLSEILGRKDTRLYYGSMVEWTADAKRPVVSARTKWDDLKKALGFGS